MTHLLDLDAEPSRIKLRGPQPGWLEDLDRDLSTHTRILCVAPGGVGKTTLFAALSDRWWQRGQRTLVLENRDRLTRQTAKRIADETGLEVEIEMADEHASPFAPIVVACTATLGKVSRLTGFSDSHFGLLVADEAHLSMAPSWQRILRYFHYGSESLTEDWQPPEDGSYEPKARIAGFTATPDIGEKRSLGEFYQMVERDGQKRWSVDYTYLDAVNDGWLVRPVQKCIPVKIDLRKYKAGHAPNGTDFKTSDLTEALIPIIEELADQIVINASDRKTIAFLPSLECATMMAEALNRRGLRAIFVSGECLDKNEKTDEFATAGVGTVLCNAVLFNYGIDFPDVNCIAWLRATLSRAFYIQGIYRGTRLLPGIVDGLATADERRAAIAASNKDHLLILDPLFVSDRIDLLDAYDLYTDKPEVKERMKAAGPPSAEAAREAERDFIKALEKEAKKHARKSARTIDPLKFALSIGDDTITNYNPTEIWEMQRPSATQIQFFEKNKIDHSAIKFKGLAQKIIGRYITRLKMGLASPHQLSFMKQLGFSDEATATMTASEAKAAIDARLKGR